MQWLPIALVAMALGAVAAVAAWAPKRTFPVRVFAVVLVVTLAAAALSSLWKQAVLALAIGSVCLLAVAVMSQKVAPRPAIVGALTAFVLFFLFSWLALKLADIFLFGKQVDLSGWRDWLGEWQAGLSSWDSLYAPPPGLPVALGLGFLLVSPFLSRRGSAVAVYAGCALLLVFATRFLGARTVYWSEAPWLEDPLTRLALGSAAVFAIARFLLSNEREGPKQGG